MTATTTAPTISAFGIPQGTFNVDASGQAGYRLALAVPPGIAGLQPQLELSYNHRQPNGLLGVGWALGGLSAIGRVKASYAVDGYNGAINYDERDRYALDGQRLINVDGDYGQPGTTYYTEIQSWKRVQAGADGAFVVTMKNGETWRYGSTPDSRILAAGGEDAAVRVWALASIEDLHGNRIDYHYSAAPVPGVADSGAYYLDSIAYSARDGVAANRLVRFTYEPRPDPLVTYTGGHPVTTALRLQRIDTWLGSELVRSYQLRYAASMATQLSCLRQIIDSGAASAGAPALPPIELDWQDCAAPGLDLGAVCALDPQLQPISTTVMDVAGTGRSDLVQLWLDQDQQLQATVYAATGDGAAVQYGPGTTSALGHFPAPRQILPADLNGDGRTDLLVVYRDPLTQHLVLAPMLSNGFGFAPQDEHDTGQPWTSDHLAFYAMDVNGDGRTDLVESYAFQDPEQGALLYFRSFLSGMGGGGAPFSEALVSPTPDPAHAASELAMWPMDVNGDGMIDMVRVWQDGADSTVHVTSYVSVATALDEVRFGVRKDSSLGTLNLTDQLAFLPADVNADGLMDLLQIWREPGQDGMLLHLSTFLSDGSGGFVAGPDSLFPNRSIDPKALLPMNLSGGLQTQLLSRWFDGNDMKLAVYASSPSGQFRLLADIDAGQADPAGGDLLLAADVTGSGKADLIRLTLQDNIPQAALYLSAGAYPDLLASLNDQLGNLTAIRYAPLSDATVYNADQPAGYPAGAALRIPGALAPTQFPVQAVLGQALYVVAGYTQSNAPARNRYALAQQFAFTYAGARIDLLGRGWQGFARVGKLDVKTGLRSTQGYLQDFPLTGMLATLGLEADGHYSADPRVPRDAIVPLTLTANRYDALAQPPGARGAVQQVQLSATRTTHYDYGPVDFAIGQVFGYDDYGNKVLDAYLGYVDPDSGAPLAAGEAVYRHASYANDAQRWVLGTPLYAKVTANAQDASITSFLPGDWRLEARTYDPGTNTLASLAQWDDGNDSYLVTSYAYDSYGNRSEQTAPGGAVTSYAYDSVYHCYLTDTIAPAAGAGQRLRTRHGFDPRFGLEIARQDENGAIFVSSLDGFGRKVLQQGPLPAPAGSQTDPNTLSNLVTGPDAMRLAFMAAPVLTLEASAYLDDGTGGIYLQQDELQTFPTDAGRQLLGKRRYQDALGREVQVDQQTEQSAGDAIVQTVYGANGKPARTSLPYFSGTQPCWSVSSYDVLARIVALRQPAGADGGVGSTTRWEYAAGGVVTQTMADGCAEAYVRQYLHRLYDQQDKVVRATGDGGAVTGFVYDPLGRLLSCTDPVTPSNPQGVRNTFSYDSLDRRRSADNPDQNASGQAGSCAMRYRYDAANGQLAQQTDAAEASSNFDYDALGRTVSRRFSDGRRIDYGYDNAESGGNARLSTVTVRDSGGGIESQRDYAYDSYGNVSGQKLQVGQPAQTFITHSSYDPQRRLVRRVEPDDTVLTRIYQGGMLLSQSLGTAVVRYPLEQRTPGGRNGRVEYGDQIVSDYVFNPAGQLYQETLSTAGQPLLRQAYQYDALNQLLSIADSAVAGTPTQQFSYRQRRLESAVMPGQADGQYQYDASGNIISKNGQRYTYSAHFPSAVGTGAGEVYTATQDACGRVASRTVDGRTLQFSYDGQGSLRRIGDADGQTVRAILSDHLGQRLQQTDQDGHRTIYVHSGYEVVLDGAGAGVTKYLRDAQGVVAAVGADAVRYFRRDHKGSVALVLDHAGAVIASLNYDAYGMPLQPQSAAADPAYEQRKWDAAIGLYYFGARYFDPFTARFLTPDNRLGAAGPELADAWNRFAFELNDPINHTDPSGHLANWLGGLLIGAVVAVAGIAIVMTGGAATPLVAALSGALIAGGATAVGYSATHRNDFSWKEWGVQSAFAAAAGGVSGGAMAGLGGMIASTSSPILYGALAGAGIGGATSALAQLGSNAALREHLGGGVALSAIFGGVLGAIGGAAGAKAAVGLRAGEAAVARTAEGGDIALQPIVRPGYGTFPRMLDVEEVDQLQLDQAAAARTSFKSAKTFNKVSNAALSVVAVPAAIFQDEDWYGALDS